jgi:hypothetical protein
MEVFLNVNIFVQCAVYPPYRESVHASHTGEVGHSHYEVLFLPPCVSVDVIQLCSH